MAMLKGVNKALLISAGILAVLILIVISATFFTSSAPLEPVILNTISLRNVEDNVQRAQLISAIDEQVSDVENAALSEQWAKVTRCLGSGCPDSAFFDTIFVATSEYPSSIPNSDLIMNVLFVNRYWGDEERIVEFSKSMTAIDSALPELDNRKAERAWSKVVECNNECEEKNDLYFEMIHSLIQ